jgi:hypothetical protein
MASGGVWYGRKILSTESIRGVACKQDTEVEADLCARTPYVAKQGCARS